MENKKKTESPPVNEAKQMTLNFTQQLNHLSNSKVVDIRSYATSKQKEIINQTIKNVKSF